MLSETSASKAAVDQKEFQVINAGDIFMHSSEDKCCISSLLYLLIPVEDRHLELKPIKDDEANNMFKQGWWHALHFSLDFS